MRARVPAGVRELGLVVALFMVYKAGRLVSGEQLAAMGSYPWDETGSVADILTSIAAHYDEHSEQLEAWLAERQAVASS